MDVVYKYNGPLPVLGAGIGLLHHFPNFLNTAGNGRKFNKPGPGSMSDNLRQCGLAHAGRSPENHRGNAVIFYEPAENTVFPHKVCLSHIFIQRFRTESCGQWLGNSVAEKRRF